LLPFWLKLNKKHWLKLRGLLVSFVQARVATRDQSNIFLHHLEVAQTEAEQFKRLLDAELCCVFLTRDVDTTVLAHPQVRAKALALAEPLPPPTTLAAARTKEKPNKTDPDTQKNRTASNNNSLQNEWR
jgi:hypothetical protein